YLITSLLNDLSSRKKVSQRKDSIISQSLKRQKIQKQKSLKKKRQSVIIKQIEDIEFIPTINDESLSTQVFNIEQEYQEIQSSIPITSESKVIYHKFGERETKSQEEPLIIIPRKAASFISATQDKQIDVEDNPAKKYKKKKRSYAITMHLLNVKRFTIPPISVINFDQTYHKYNDNIEIKNEKFEQSRLQHLLKSMIKNFDFDNNFQKYNKEIQNIDLDKELFDFNNDIKEIDQSAMFTEYILFKYIDKLILVCAHTDEFHSLNKYLMSDISYYFDDDFIDESDLFQNQRNLDNYVFNFIYFIIEYLYFSRIESRIKQSTQRFHDDYIVKEFFNCWKDYTVEQARIAELRRKRITIDFREFWF
ncbi:unnamed protein product, partial [Rotaria sp. Silwood1]